MKHGWLAAATLSVVVVYGGGATLAAEQSVSRTLSVEQTTIKDVVTPGRLDTSRHRRARCSGVGRSA